jgi:uncharacterized membrane protein YccC
MLEKSVRSPGRPLPRRINSVLRWAARRLELRSFGLIPEQFNELEGFRAAIAVALPLALAVGTGRAWLGWAVFAAFWTCLCDAPGPDGPRQRILAIFVAAGTLLAVAGSWMASKSPFAAMIAGPGLVLAAVICSSRIAFGGLLGTLLAVVAVVAVGFPRPIGQAGVQAAAFLGGAGWSYLLINALWRIDPMLPLSRATDAVIVRLIDMAESLAMLGEQTHRDDSWHREHAEHRRSVRLAFERLRALLERYRDESSAWEPYAVRLEAAETMFGGLIALDQAFIDRQGPAAERLSAARGCRTALLAWCLASRRRRVDVLSWAAARLRRLAVRSHDDLFIGCTIAFADASCMFRASLTRSTPRLRSGGESLFAAGKIPHEVLRQGLRLAAALVAVYCAASAFGLGYPYWAAMAVIVVLQGGARVTWPRCLERILGSIIGGTIALLILLLVGGGVALSVLAVFLAADAIATRLVNYTIFVVFLTMLFVIVTELLNPGAGVASARMVDNIIGSMVAVLAVFLLWPDFGASLDERIDQGILANRLYVETVERRRPVAEIEAARRSAGLASVEAEIALYDVGSLMRRFKLPGMEGSALRELRRTSGEAAMAWHRHLGTLPLGRGGGSAPKPVDKAETRDVED